MQGITKISYALIMQYFNLGVIEKKKLSLAPTKTMFKKQKVRKYSISTPFPETSYWWRTGKVKELHWTTSETGATFFFSGCIDTGRKSRFLGLYLTPRVWTKSSKESLRGQLFIYCFRGRERPACRFGRSAWARADRAVPGC